MRHQSARGRIQLCRDEEVLRESAYILRVDRDKTIAKWRKEVRHLKGNFYIVFLPTLGVYPSKKKSNEQ